MKFLMLSCFAACALMPLLIASPGAGAAEQELTWLVGGQSCRCANGYTAKIASPLAKDAAVQIPDAQGTIIANVFPSDAAGKVDNAANPKTIMASGTTTFKLNQTSDNSELTPGTYVINAMANNRTCRALFTIK